MSVQGKDKVGKTHLTLTAPKPLAFFNLDFGTEGVIHKFAGEDIWQVDLPCNIEVADADAAKDTYMEILQKFQKAYKYSLQHAKTIVEDTSTEVWELLRLAYFGKLTQIMPHHYTQINSIFRQHVKDAYDAGINLIMIHKLKDEWVNNSSTGKQIRDGFKGIHYLAQCMVECWKTLEPLSFGCTIMECRQNPEITGATLEGDFYDFDALLAEVFG